MATLITGIGQSKVISNLDTYNHTTALASMYTVSCAINERPASGITLTIQQNGSTLASTAIPAAMQEVVQLNVLMNCAIGDLISIIVASSTSHDAKSNDFKGVITIRPGTI